MAYHTVNQTWTVSSSEQSLTLATWHPHAPEACSGVIIWDLDDFATILHIVAAMKESMFLNTTCLFEALLKFKENLLKKKQMKFIIKL